MFVKLNQINTHIDGSYYLSEVRLNVSHITYITENHDFKTSLSEGKIDVGLHPSTTFTNITLSNSRGKESIVVVGGPDLIESKINRPYKQLLRG